jgi:hypothetical protein
MKILNYYVRKRLSGSVRDFEKATMDPLAAQERTLLEFVRRHKDTVYGREHSFESINSIDDYRRRVPVNDYESLRPYIKQVIEGREGVLTKDRIILFGTTSGTTGQPKHIPVTGYSARKKREIMNLWLYHILKDYPDLLKGKILAIVSPEKESCTANGFPCGAETGHAYKNMPALIRYFYALPYEVFEIKDYTARYYCILRLSMEHDVTALATLNPSTITLLCRKVGDFAGSIIDDIEKGDLSREFEINGEIRTRIKKRLRPNPGRAAFLRKLLAESGRLEPRHFWPGLQLIQCWKGGTVGLYLREFPEYFGCVPVRDFGYVSSEARCSVPTDNERCCGILAVKTNFYEFIPKEERGKNDPEILTCDRLEPGGEYYMLITTPGGLYRYDIDDVVRVTCFHNRTPRIEFMHKGLNVTSLTGEKLYESHVVEAIRGAVERTGVSIEFFTACIEWRKAPRYAFLVEFKSEAGRAEKMELLRNIDDGIKSVNIEYRSKRESERLDDPVLKVVKRGEFHNYRMKRVVGGAHDGQFKVPKLTGDLCFQNHFDIEEEISLRA